MKQEDQIKEVKWENDETLIWKNPAEETYYLRKRWELRKLDRFLDLGCATGRHALFFAEDGYTVTAYQSKNDSLSELLEKVNELGLEMKYVHGPLTSLSLSDESFDCVLAYDCLHELNQDEMIQVFKEVYRSLKVGGECYMTLPNTFLSKKLIQNFSVISYKKVTTFTQNNGSECYHLLLKK